MIFVFTVNTPANTLAINKKETTLKLCSGVIHKIDLVFPPGAAGFLHLTLNQALHQVWPTNPDESFAADSETISFPEFYELDQPPYELTAWTWSEGSTYPHSVIIRLGILPKKYLAPWLMTLGEKIKELTGA